MDPTLAALIGFTLGSAATHVVYFVVLLADERSRRNPKPIDQGHPDGSAG